MTDAIDLDGPRGVCPHCKADVFLNHPHICVDGGQASASSRPPAMPLMDVFADVGAFHAKFSLPLVGQRRPHLLDAKAFKYRTNFLFEELREFIEAHGEGDLYKCVDALADLIYVAAGTAHYMHAPLDLVWAEVQRANLDKRAWREGDPVKARNGAGATKGFEVVKPEGWKPPDVIGVIDDFERNLASKGVLD